MRLCNLKNEGFVLKKGKVYLLLREEVPEFIQVLQLNKLRVSYRKESYIRKTQENLIENSVQNCLPYIPYNISYNIISFRTFYCFSL